MALQPPPKQLSRQRAHDAKKADREQVRRDARQQRREAEYRKREAERKRQREANIRSTANPPHGTTYSDTSATGGIVTITIASTGATFHMGGIEPLD